MGMRPSMRLSCPTWPAALLVLAVGTHAGSIAGQPGRSFESTTRVGATERPATGRPPDRLWPSGTPRQVVLGSSLDPAFPVVDAPRARPYLEHLPPADPTSCVGGWPPSRSRGEAEREGREDGTWSLMPPPGRVFHSAAYDPVRRRVVLFGGTDGVERNDVWTLSLTKDSSGWRQLPIHGEPPKPRGHAAMLYDPTRDRMIVYGGSNQPGQSGATLYGDVWELTLKEHPTWRLILPGGVGPSPRRGASAIYDPVGDRMVVFGGLTDVGWSGETWTLSLKNGGAWARLDAPGTSPQPRWQHSAVYDPVRQQMVVFGGNGTFGLASNDAYALSLGVHPTWTRIDPASGLPPPRFVHSAIYDPVHSQMVVFGGESASF